MKSFVRLWHKAPFIRLVFPLALGIVVQWQQTFTITSLLSGLVLCLGSIFIFFFLPLHNRYGLASANGIMMNICIGLTGALLTWLHDIRNDKNWLGHLYKDGDYIVAALEEDPVQKANSLKALASVHCTTDGRYAHAVSGKMIIYFKKEGPAITLHYGDQVVFKKSIQEIKNSGNPGSFEFKTFCLFQGITHQVYLTAIDFAKTDVTDRHAFIQFIFDCRKSVITILRKYITGIKEQGLAEALLIGYKDDLDKELVLSYTNTGVVHIIAISGMHLALIYGLLQLFTRSLQRNRKFRWTRIVLILCGLWIFSFIAGAQASVLRSTLMFSCIALGEGAERKTSVYNTLALSAFLLICYDPFVLWDVGFQLSYAAVVSIVVFYRPVYNCVYLPNKLLDAIWKTIAISIAAQILTTPISLYHFHQFPVLFLLTNLVAVPLSGIILFGEIFLCAIAWLSPLATPLGWLIQFMIRAMNNYIARLESVSFSVWEGFSISWIQCALLLFIAAGIYHWLLEKNKPALWLSLAAVLTFISLRSLSFIQCDRQKTIIVYNVPRCRAIDLIDGRSCHFIGDQALLDDEPSLRFYLGPSRIRHRIKNKYAGKAGLKDITFCGQRMIVIDSTLRLRPQPTMCNVDLLILSKNSALSVSQLARTFTIRLLLMDSSIPPWKARRWKNECDSLQLPYYDINEKGAFVMNL